MAKFIPILVASAFALALPAALAQTAPEGSGLPEGAPEIAATLPAATAMNAIWAGVATQEQMMRGQVIYSGNCAKCHGRNGNGAGEPDQPDSPAIARAAFLAKWDGQNLGLLFEYVHQYMPIDNPMTLSPEQYIDAIAYVMSLSQVPPGMEELPPDLAVLVNYQMSPKPAAQ